MANADHDGSAISMDATLLSCPMEVAQFIYLLLSRQKLRNVITTLGEKAVLILGRFTERRELLDRMADKLRSLGYLPMIRRTPLYSVSKSLPFLLSRVLNQRISSIHPSRKVPQPQNAESRYTAGTREFLSTHSTSQLCNGEE
jgi:hypothetical protein